MASGSRLSKKLVALACAIALPLCPGLAGCGTRLGYEPEQPVAFSHASHAGEHHIPCLYCHYGALGSRHAGLPATSVCMNCHGHIRRDSPQVQRVAASITGGAQRLEWVRVHRLPDHTWFSHASHQAAGVECRECHGPVERMVRVRQSEPMTMASCLDCHRKPALSPSSATRRRASTDCIACHR